MVHRASPGSPRHRRWSLAAVCVGWLAVATVLQLARQRGAPAVDTIWAEDGRVFLTGVLNQPFPATLGEPYMGYLHTLPRLLAGLAAAFPLGWAALVLSVVPAVLVSALSVYVAFAAAAELPSRWSRLVVVGAVVLLPAAGFETLNNAANLQWFLLFGCFWAVVHVPRSPLALWLECVLIGAIAVTAPLAAVFLPIALGRVLPFRREALPKLMVLLSGAALQAVLGIGQGPQAWTTSRVLDLPGLFGLRVVGALVTGDVLVEEVWGAVGWWFGYAALALFGVFLAWAAPRLAPARRRTFWEALVASVLLFAVPALVRGTEHLAPVGERFSLAGSRYVVAPMLLVVAMAVMALEDGTRRERSGRWVRRTVAAVAVLLALSGFLVHNLRSLGPLWSDNVAAAEQRCTSGRAGVRIPVAPPDPTMWYVDVGCERLSPAR